MQAKHSAKKRQPKITPLGIKRGALIKQKRMSLDEAQHELAVRFGVEQASVGRWEAGWPIDQDHWPAIANFLGKSQSELFLESPEPPRPDLQRPLAATVPIIGEALQGAWRDVHDSPGLVDAPTDEHIESSDVLGQPYIAAVQDPRYRHMKQFAVRVPGTSMNKRIPDGGYVVCVPYWDARKALTDGDMVLAQRRRSDQYQITVKRLRLVEGHWELHPESTDPKWQDPIVLDEGDHLTEHGAAVETTVEILGQVIWIVSKP